MKTIREEFKNKTEEFLREHQGHPDDVCLLSPLIKGSSFLSCQGWYCRRCETGIAIGVKADVFKWKIDSEGKAETFLRKEKKK